MSELSSMTLSDVLTAHLYRESTAGRAAHCSCGMWLLGATAPTHRGHVETEIFAWISARLNDATADIAEAIFNATDPTLRKRYEEGNSVSGYDDEYATAATAAFKGALGIEVAA